MRPRPGPERAVRTRLPTMSDPGAVRLPTAPRWPAIDAAFAAPGGAVAVFDAAMAALGQALRADRCFLYLRDASAGVGAVVACWSAQDRWPDLRGDPAPEPEDLAEQDPLMAWAYRSPNALFVDDIETAGAEVLNVGLERDGFGHRALIHAPIVVGERMLGILEPCVFEAPRTWTAADQVVVAAVQARLGPIALAAIDDGLLRQGAPTAG